jgi:hypothetical protein
VPSPIGVADLSADLSHAASNSFGSLYLSPRTMTAQAIRAILLASATAATLVGRRSINRPSHGFHRSLPCATDRAVCREPLARPCGALEFGLRQAGDGLEAAVGLDLGEEDLARAAIVARTADPRNARTHPKRQIDQIRASIEAFGFTNPVLADPEGHIIAGHGRLQAARAMGLAELPVITLSGLSETQKRTLRIADNKIALNAGWDLEILQLELGELGSIDVDIDPTLTGFSTGEIDVILTSAVDPDDEVIPPVPATPKTCSQNVAS